MTKVKESPPATCVWDTPAWDAGQARLMTADWKTWFRDPGNVGHVVAPTTILSDDVIKRLIPDVLVSTDPTMMKFRCISNAQKPDPTTIMRTFFTWLELQNIVIIVNSGSLRAGVSAWDQSTLTMCVQFIQGMRKGEATFASYILKIEPLHNRVTRLGYGVAVRLFDK